MNNSDFRKMLRALDPELTNREMLKKKLRKLREKYAKPFAEFGKVEISPEDQQILETLMIWHPHHNNDWKLHLDHMYQGMESRSGGPPRPVFNFCYEKGYAKHSTISYRHYGHSDKHIKTNLTEISHHMRQAVGWDVWQAKRDIPGGMPLEVDHANLGGFKAIRDDFFKEYGRFELDWTAGDGYHLPETVRQYWVAYHRAHAELDPVDPEIHTQRTAERRKLEVA